MRCTPKTPSRASESLNNSRRLSSKARSQPGFTLRVIATWIGIVVLVYDRCVSIASDKASTAEPPGARHGAARATTSLGGKFGRGDHMTRSRRCRGWRTRSPMAAVILNRRPVRRHGQRRRREPVERRRRVHDFAADHRQQNRSMPHWRLLMLLARRDPCLNASVSDPLSARRENAPCRSSCVRRLRRHAPAERFHSSPARR